MDIRYAIGASLVSVIATSSGAAAAYVREGYSNIRVGMFLEIATTVGALSGALIAPFVPPNGLALVFGLCPAVFSLLVEPSPRPCGWRPCARPMGEKLRLDSTYPTAGGLQPYRVQHVPAGFGLMYGAGVLSGLLGIGSGAVKVLAMDQAMRLPFKVSTTTSNFMIGVTAAASAGIYLHRGYIDPGSPCRSSSAYCSDRCKARRPRRIARIDARRKGTGHCESGPLAPGVHVGDCGPGVRDAVQWRSPGGFEVDRREGWTDEQFDIVLAHVLRIGVVTSALVVAFGGIVFLVRHGLERPSYHVFRGEPGNLTSLRGSSRKRCALAGAGLCSWVCCCSLRRQLRAWCFRSWDSSDSVTGSTSGSRQFLDTSRVQLACGLRRPGESGCDSQSCVRLRRHSCRGVGGRSCRRKLTFVNALAR